jgi:hypothetical protein
MLAWLVLSDTIRARFAVPNTWSTKSKMQINGLRMALHW